MTLKEVLEEQIKSSQNDISFYEEQLKRLPKGTFHSIIINGNRVNYLKDYDDRGKRVERTVDEEELEIVNRQLQMRNQIEQWLHELKEEIEAAENTIHYIRKDNK
ncbi:hypothetical protein [Isachenkonia alkalipeptolytica]|uniref:Uncharacterized protein n=1 Tax=Isachenkonia alkalipeptolytica TaxID=2565777 RepID=A0AA43XIY2_9CLOT|nr:hypothetical protein [Isachenkonia alkalipeptolytica]NBG87069.1 hypothetical protein [Isachenkonia alkalipeptolytica]